MASVTGLPKLLAQLKAKAARGKSLRLVVGYNASYAVHVHEDLQVFHPNGQAKFLEIPLRTQRTIMAKMVRDALRNGKTLTQALTTAGQYLLGESVKLVPVRTGFLRDSAFLKIVDTPTSNTGLGYYY